MKPATLAMAAIGITMTACGSVIFGGAAVSVVEPRTQIIHGADHDAAYAGHFRLASIIVPAVVIISAVIVATTVVIVMAIVMVSAIVVIPVAPVVIISVVPVVIIAAPVMVVIPASPVIIVGRGSGFSMSSPAFATPGIPGTGTGEVAGDQLMQKTTFCRHGPGGSAEQQHTCQRHMHQFHFHSPCDFPPSVPVTPTVLLIRVQHLA